MEDRMSMNRVIHGAIRRDLDRFVDALSAFPVGERGRADDLYAAWQHFASQLERHHRGEHAIAWPALRQVGVSESLLTAMDLEHDAMAQALTVAGETMTALVHTPGRRQAVHAGNAMKRLRAVTVDHLEHEEAELEVVYLTNEDHPAIVAMQRAFRREGGPVQGGRLLAWLLDGATPEQQARIEQLAPAPVLAFLVGVLGRGYRRRIAPVWEA